MWERLPSTLLVCSSLTDINIDMPPDLIKVKRDSDAAETDDAVGQMMK